MSAYRTGGADARAITVALLCTECGARSEHRLNVEAFRCSTCTTEQLVLRDDPLAERPGIVATRWLDAKYKELLPFAESLGLAVEGPLAFELVLGGATLEVKLEFGSSNVQGLEIVAPAEGLTPMKLRRESVGDARAKAEGITREVQTGDSAFDAAVFVESNAADVDVLAMLGSNTVRAAIRLLLSTVPELEITSAGLKLSLPAKDESYEPARIAAQLGALRVIVGAPRPVSPQAIAPPPPRVAIALGALTLPAIGLAIFAGNVYSPTSPTPVLLGIGLGLAAALGCSPLISRALRGRSTSRREIIFARAISSIAGPLLGVGLILLINGVFDRSPRKTHQLEGYEVKRGDDTNTSFVHAHGIEPSVGEREYAFEDPGEKLVLPAHIEVDWGEGALGFTWQDGPARCQTKTAKWTE